MSMSMTLAAMPIYLHTNKAPRRMIALLCSRSYIGIAPNVKISQLRTLNCISKTTASFHEKLKGHSSNAGDSSRVISRNHSSMNCSTLLMPSLLDVNSLFRNSLPDHAQCRTFSSLLSSNNKHKANRVLLNACQVFSRNITSQKSRSRKYEGMTEEEIMAAITKQRIMEAGLLDEPLHKVPDSFNDSAGWIMRLANENGYSSFCRNSYLAMMVAITVNLQDHMLPCYKEVSFLFLLIGASQLTYGTATYIYTILKLRRRAFMSRCLALTVCCFALFHLFLWAGAVLIYMGYADDTPSAEVSSVPSEINPASDVNSEQNSIKKV